jgi:hypothetical protein
MRTRFENADEAFGYFLNEIRCNGIEFGDTKALFNVGFTLEKPRDMFILDRERNWNREYAEAEWQWFGFCNDQYCFASLQMLVAYQLGIDVGEYYHYAHNLHLYNNKL